MNTEIQDASEAEGREMIKAYIASAVLLSPIVFWIVYTGVMIHGF